MTLRVEIMTVRAHLFDTLPARPPTPPRDFHRDIADALDFLEDGFNIGSNRQSQDHRSSALDTPPDTSPSSSAEQPNNPLASKLKKVGFSPLPAYTITSQSSQQARTLGSSPLRPLPQGITNAPLKSILKPRKSTIHKSPPASQADIPRLQAMHFDTMARRLDACLEGLAGDARDRRLDAYMVMVNALKSHVDGTDSELANVKARLGELSVYIQRDCSTINPLTDTVDMNLTTQSLKLFSSLLRLPCLASNLEDDFCAFILDQAIATLAHEEPVKALATHYLFILSQQTFRPKVLTANKADQVLSLLQDIECKVKGNSILVHKLLIYSKFLGQVRAVMLARITDWLQFVFDCMLDNQNEVRLHAIETGNEAANCLGRSHQASKATAELFSKASEGSVDYGHCLMGRMRKMVKTGSDRYQAPQIWGIVILLLRAEGKRLPRWKHFKPWAELVQVFFNAGDMKVKLHTSLAWNRLVYVVSPDSRTPTYFIRMLRSPILVQMHTPPTNNAKDIKALGVASYTNLLYYAFRPGASPEQLDLFWEHYVQQVLDAKFLISPKDGNIACRILAALLTSRKGTFWDEQRAIEPRALKMDELPRLDVKWVRRHARLILGTVKGCLETAEWPSNNSNSVPVKNLWTNLMETIAEAGSKEVQATMELKEAIAQITNLLHQIWTTRPACLNADCSDSGIFVERYSFLAQTAVATIGPLHFGDKIIAQNQQDQFEPAPTPSHRSRTSGPLVSPIVHLVHLLSTDATNEQEALTRSLMARSLLRPCLQARNNHQSRLRLLREAVEALGPAKSTIATSTRAALLECLQDVAKSSSEPSRKSYARSPSECEDEVAVIYACLPNEGIDPTGSIQTSVLRYMQSLFGDEENGREAYSIFDSLAAMVTTRSTSMGVGCALCHASILLTFLASLSPAADGGNLWRSLLGLDRQRGVRIHSTKPGSVTSMITHLLDLCYESVGSANHGRTMTFLGKLQATVVNCPSSLLPAFLHAVQGGFSTLVLDAQGKAHGTSSEAVQFSEAVSNNMKATAVWY